MGKAMTPAEAWNGWVTQSVDEFMSYSQGQTVRQAVEEYVAAIPEMGPQCDAIPPEDLAELLIEYIKQHQRKTATVSASSARAI